MISELQRPDGLHVILLQIPLDTPGDSCQRIDISTLSSTCYRKESGIRMDLRRWLRLQNVDREKVNVGFGFVVAFGEGE